MKKLLILFAALLMGVTASFGQAYTINVQWDEALCDCLGTDEDNYFEIDYKIIDVANGNTEVISLTTVQTPNANYSRGENGPYTCQAFANGLITLSEVTMQ